MSRSDTTSTTSNMPRAESPVINHMRAQSDPAFKFHPLRSLSHHLFSRRSGTSSPIRPSTSVKTNGADTLGAPTVMDVRGMIAVGTAAGWVLVYSFGQELKHVLGTEAIGESPHEARLTRSHRVRCRDRCDHLCRPDLCRRRPRLGQHLSLRPLKPGQAGSHCSRVDAEAGPVRPQRRSPPSQSHSPRWIRRRPSHFHCQRGRRWEGFLVESWQSRWRREHRRRTHARKLSRKRVVPQAPHDAVRKSPIAIGRRQAPHGSPPTLRPTHSRQARHRGDETFSQDLVSQDAGWIWGRARRCCRLRQLAATGASGCELGPGIGVQLGHFGPLSPHPDRGIGWQRHTAICGRPQVGGTEPGPLAALVRSKRENWKSIGTNFSICSF
jgi:hypothetical protein